MKPAQRKNHENLVNLYRYLKRKTPEGRIFFSALFVWGGLEFRDTHLFGILIISFRFKIF